MSATHTEPQPNAFGSFLRGIRSEAKYVGLAVLDRLVSRGPRALMAMVALAVVLTPAALSRPDVAPSPDPQPKVEQNDGVANQGDLLEDLGRNDPSEPFVFPGATRN